MGLTGGGGIHVEAVDIQDGTLRALLTAVRDDVGWSLRARVQLVGEGKGATEGDTHGTNRCCPNDPAYERRYFLRLSW